MTMKLSDTTLSYKTRPSVTRRCRHCKKETEHHVCFDPNCVVPGNTEEPPKRGTWVEICLMCQATSPAEAQ